MVAVRARVGFRLVVTVSLYDFLESEYVLFVCVQRWATSLRRWWCDRGRTWQCIACSTTTTSTPARPCGCSTSNSRSIAANTTRSTNGSATTCFKFLGWFSQKVQWLSCVFYVLRLFFPKTGQPDHSASFRDSDVRPAAVHSGVDHPVQPDLCRRWDLLRQKQQS